MRHSRDPLPPEHQLYNAARRAVEKDRLHAQHYGADLAAPFYELGWPDRTKAVGRRERGSARPAPSPRLSGTVSSATRLRLRREMTSSC